MTNGEKMKSVFGLDINVLETSNYSYIVPMEWWNAEYKEPNTKNDLGVDCISRADAERILTTKITRIKRSIAINIIDAKA